MATVSTSFKLDQAGFNATLKGPNGASATAVHRKGQRVLNLAREKCPVDTGRTRASLHLEMRLENGLPVARVGSNLPHVVFVHEGTGIYAGRGYITPRTARVLRWPNTGGTSRGGRRYAGGSTESYIYATRVRGQRAQPFLRDALAAAR